MSDPSLGQVVSEVLAKAGVENVELHVITRKPSFRGAETSETASAITAIAREEHLRRGFGFWEYTLSAALETDPATRDALIAGALRHHSAETIAMTMTREELAEALASLALEGLPARTMVMLTSRVETAGTPIETMHLPMLDLSAPISSLGQEAAISALRHLELTGVLLESGRSYHFLGNQLHEHGQWRRALARAQLLSPLVDSRWASHQLVDGFCALRISTDVERNTDAHRFVTWID